MADHHWIGTTSTAWTTVGNWSDTAGGVPNLTIPTNADNAIFSAADASNCTTGSGATCLNLTCTGYTGTLTVSGGAFTVLGNVTGASGMTLAGTSAVTCSGGITTVSGMTWTHTGLWTFNATSGTHDINFTGVTLNNGLTFNGVGGTWQFVGNITNGFSRAITVTNGHLDFNDINYTGGSLVSNNENTRTISMGNGTITLGLTTGSVINFGNTTGLTFNGEGSTIVLSADVTTGRTISVATTGDGVTFNNVTFSGPNTGDLNLSSAAGKTITFNTFTISDAPQEIIITAGVTVSATTWVISGTSGNLNVFTSATPGSQYTFNKAGGGFVAADYVSFTDCVGTPAESWFVGIHSTNGGNNIGLTFDDGPGTVSTGSRPTGYQGNSNGSRPWLSGAASSRPKRFPLGSTRTPN